MLHIARKASTHLGVFQRKFEPSKSVAACFACMSASIRTRGSWRLRYRNRAQSAKAHDIQPASISMTSRSRDPDGCGSTVSVWHHALTPAPFSKDRNIIALSSHSKTSMKYG